MKGQLALEDGTLIEGDGFGASGTAKGELVFETGMTGYVQALTDPSYNGQILMFTYPLIGNYGVNSDDYQSDGIRCEGLVIKDLCEYPSNWRSEQSLDQFLKEQDIPGIEGIDTRMLTRKARIHGTMKAVVHVGDEREKEDLMTSVKDLPSIEDMSDLVDEVSTDEVIRYEEGHDQNIVMIDCGYKDSILGHLRERNVDIQIVPHDTPADVILEERPDGVLISNGPGNPELLDTTIETATDLGGEVPLFGICLGHQIIALANGAESFKLKYGHRGINHPVKDLKTDRVFISTQNHGFAIDDKSLERSNIDITQINLNDDTVEAIEHESLPIKAVQYHPEANPGPHDTYFFFDEMFETIEN